MIIDAMLRRPSAGYHDEPYDYPMPPIEVEVAHLLHALADEGRRELIGEEWDVLLAAFMDGWDVWPDQDGSPQMVICRAATFAEVAEWCSENLTGMYSILMELPDDEDGFVPAIAIHDDTDMALARLTYE